MGPGSGDERFDVFLAHASPDKARLIDSAVHVAPDTGDADVGFVDEPAATDRVPARSRGIDQLRV